MNDDVKMDVCSLCGKETLHNDSILILLREGNWIYCNDCLRKAIEEDKRRWKMLESLDDNHN